MIKSISIIIVFIFSIYNISFCNFHKIKNENELREKTFIFINSIINIQFNQLSEVLMPNGGIEIGTDLYMTKNEIIDDLNKKGKLYSYLFDTKKYNENYREYLKQFNSKNKLDYKLCLKDLFIKVKSKKIQIRDIEIFNNNPNMVEIEITWAGKDAANSESKNIRYVISFSLVNNKWYISSLNNRIELFN